MGSIADNRNLASVFEAISHKPISYANLSDELYDAVIRFYCQSSQNQGCSRDNYQMAFAWLEAIGPQEFLELMKETQ